MRKKNKKSSSEKDSSILSRKTLHIATRRGIKSKLRTKDYYKAKLKLHQPYEFKAILIEHTHTPFQSKQKWQKLDARKKDHRDTLDTSHQILSDEQAGDISSSCSQST